MFYFPCLIVLFGFLNSYAGRHTDSPWHVAIRSGGAPEEVSGHDNRIANLVDILHDERGFVPTALTAELVGEFLNASRTMVTADGVVVTYLTLDPAFRRTVEALYGRLGGEIPQEELAVSTSNSRTTRDLLQSTEWALREYQRRFGNQRFNAAMPLDFVTRLLYPSTTHSVTDTPTATPSTKSLKRGRSSMDSGFITPPNPKKSKGSSISKRKLDFAADTCKTSDIQYSNFDDDDLDFGGGEDFLSSSGNVSFTI